MPNRVALCCLMASFLVAWAPAMAGAQVVAGAPVPDTSCAIFPADNI